MATLNLNHLYYFYEVARHGSFTAAARDLLVSQSALSVQIRVLEASLGGPLFDRRRGGVSLTESGQRAFETAERVFADVDRLVAELQQTDRLVSGAVNLGTVDSIGLFVLPDVLTVFREKFPDIIVRVDFRGSDRVIDNLSRGKTDLAIVPWERAYPGLAATPLTRQKMFLIAPPDHPLSRAERVSPRDLERFPFVGYHEGMHTRALTDALFKRMSLKIEYAVESANAATIKQMVLTGMGLAFVPEPAVTAEIRRGQLVRLDLPTLVMSQEVTLYVRRNRTLSRSAAGFMDFLRDYFDTGRRVSAKRRR
jgi:DNA-binding transcriptional LysR family regulator